MKSLYQALLLLFCLSVATAVEAGNPDRQGEAGAYELLMNPWARSAGLHTMTTANISGVEAIRLNVAGLSRIGQTEIQLGHAIYLDGVDINMNALGLAQRVGKNGAFGVSLMALDFGEIPLTTVNQPEGTGVTFSPSFFNLGLSYAHTFENKVSVGVTFRAINESTSDVQAFGFGIDAGVQYVTGPQDNFKFGISLRNVGSRMSFKGEGLAVQLAAPDNVESYNLTYDTRSTAFEIPSLLNIGLSYDFIVGERNRLTFVSNFTAHSFSQDEIGAGIEFSYQDIFMVRGGYKTDFGAGDSTVGDQVYSGIAAGATLNIPLSKENNNRVGLDYAYRFTRVWNGTHNLSLRIAL